MSTDNDLVPRLRLWAEGLQNQKAVVIAVAITEAADEIELLRAERDEARRELCELEAELPEERLVVWNAARLPNDLAAKRGWDCFDRSKYAKRRKPIAK